MVLLPDPFAVLVVQADPRVEVPARGLHHRLAAGVEDRGEGGLHGVARALRIAPAELGRHEEVAVVVVRLPAGVARLRHLECAGLGRRF